MMCEDAEVLPRLIYAAQMLLLFDKFSIVFQDTDYFSLAVGSLPR